MATSGQISAKYSSIDNVKVVLSWKRTGFSVANNYSDIEWELKLVSGSALLLPINETYTLQIHGKEYTGKAETSIGANTTKVLASGTERMNHSADGSLSFSYNFSLSRIRVDFGTSSAGSIDTIDTIPRKATISSAVDFNDEENPTITYSNISGTLVTRVEACISLTGADDDVPYREISKTGTSYTFNLTSGERATLRNAITSGNSRTVRFYVKTTIGTETFWSYLTKTLTLVNYEPTFVPYIIDTNPTTAMLTGDIYTLVRYYSSASVNFNAEGRKGATIKTKTASNGSQTITTEDASQTLVLNNVADNVFNLSVTDSRGYTTSQQKHFKGDSFIPYFNVTCAQTIRLNLDRTISLAVDGKYYDGSFGAVDNELIIETRHKENGGEWSDWEVITPLVSDRSNNSYTLNATLSGYNPSGSYDFQCRASDKLSSAESAIETVTLEPLFSWGRNDFKFNVPVTFDGEPLVDFVIEEGTEGMGTNGIWYWCKWKSGKAECYGCRNYGNMAVTTAWGGLYRSATFVQELPFALFNGTPDVMNISLRNTSNYGGWVVRHEESAPSDFDTGSFIVVRPASATLTQAYISFHIIGRWM